MCAALVGIVNVFFRLNIEVSKKLRPLFFLIIKITLGFSRQLCQAFLRLQNEGTGNNIHCRKQLQGAFIFPVFRKFTLKSVIVEFQPLL